MWHWYVSTDSLRRPRAQPKTMNSGRKLQIDRANLPGTPANPARDGTRSLCVFVPTFLAGVHRILE